MGVSIFAGREKTPHHAGRGGQDTPITPGASIKEKRGGGGRRFYLPQAGIPASFFHRRGEKK